MPFASAKMPPDIAPRVTGEGKSHGPLAAAAQDSDPKTPRERLEMGGDRRGSAGSAPGAPFSDVEYRTGRRGHGIGARTN